MSKTILFFGNERLATGVTTQTPILKQLVLNGYDVKAMVITPRQNHSSRKPRQLEAVEFASGHGIQIIEAAKLRDQLKALETYNAEVAVLAAFGKIVPQEVIDIFPRGIINIHPSLLPKHRGSMPIEGPILTGEKETGVSLMKLVKEMDAGPVYDQVKIPLNGSESKQELSDRLGELGAIRLIELLPGILDGWVLPKPQSTDGISYDSRITAEMSAMDFRKTAALLEREIRAFLGWPRSRTIIGQKPVIVTSAHALAETTDLLPGKFSNINGELAVGTAQGLLVIDKLIPVNSKEMSGKDFLRGHPLN